MISAMTTVANGVPATQWNERLADGTPVTIRTMRRADAALEYQLLDACSPQTRRMRFLGAVRPSLELARTLTRDTVDRGAGLFAIAEERGQPCAVGECSFRVDPEGTAAECEVVVRDDWQGRGLGVALMRHLIEIARRHGVLKLVAIDAAQNTAMRDLAAFLGFERHAYADDATLVVHTLAL